MGFFSDNREIARKTGDQGGIATRAAKAAARRAARKVKAKAGLYRCGSCSAKFGDVAKLADHMESHF